MNPTFILILPSDWPQLRREAPWLLIDENGQVTQRGCSEPAHWPIPAASPSAPPTPCIVFLAGRQVSHHRSRLPKQQATPEIAASALEDGLLDDAEQLLFSIAPGNEESERSIGVVSSQRLDSLLALLPPLGLAARAVWPLGQALPENQAWLVGDELTLKLADDRILSLPIDDHLSEILEHLPGDSVVLSCIRFDRQLSVSAAHAVDALLATGRLQTSTADCLEQLPGSGFLYGTRQAEVARRFDVKSLQPGLRLAAAFALSIFVLILAQWGWLTWQAHALQAEIATLFHLAEPKATLVDPPRQLQRLVDDLRHAQGQLTGNDMLRLLAPLGEIGGDGISIDGIDYADGQLHVEAKVSPETLSRLRVAAMAEGISLTADGQAAPSSLMRLRFTDGVRP